MNMEAIQLLDTDIERVNVMMETAGHVLTILYYKWLQKFDLTV